MERVYTSCSWFSNNKIWILIMWFHLLLVKVVYVKLTKDYSMVTVTCPWHSLVLTFQVMESTNNIWFSWFLFVFNRCYCIIIGVLAIAFAGLRPYFAIRFNETMTCTNFVEKKCPHSKAHVSITMLPTFLNLFNHSYTHTISGRFRQIGLQLWLKSQLHIYQ